VATLSLKSDEAHLYCFSLDVPGERRQALAQLLTPEEASRFARLVREIDRERYVAARGALRKILAHYLPLAPEQIAIRVGPQGKPFVAPDLFDLPLEFNLSHSGGSAVALVARVPVGIDLEVLREDVKAEAVAGSYFTPEEQIALQSATREERVRQFFRIWTRKEAFLKGIGSGLSIRASSVSIEPRLLPKGSRLRIHAPTLDPEPNRWLVRDLDLSTPLIGALAFRGELEHLTLQALPE
jgi:4'-phosphopantetheinyl transferase